MTAATRTEPHRGDVVPSVDETSPPLQSERIYTGLFWAAYAANVIVVTANGLTFRFAELVGFAGGGEQTAGVIIGVAMGIALFARLFLGQAIDRYGVRRLWLITAVAFALGGLLLTLTDDLSWRIYLGRALFAIGLSGALTCSAVHIQSLAPAHRRTEILASLGSSGFVGMILGALLGDVIFLQLEGRVRFLVLFGSATLAGALYLAFVHAITRGDRHERPASTPPLHHLLFRYWPGNVLSVAFIMGMMLAVTTVFLTRFATYHGMSGIGAFFTGYAVTAFIFRVVSRGWSRTIGRHRLILMGLAGHVLAMFLLPLATTPLAFAIPAIFGGFGHAMLFPAVVSLGSEAFPRQYRGTGTTVVMSFFEVGVVVSAPILGTIIEAFDGHGFVPMFLFAGASAIAVGVVYALTTARTADRDLIESRPGAKLAAGGTLGIGPLMARHSPIEPLAKHASATHPATGATASGESPATETRVVLRHDEPASPRRENQATGISPATRCR